jgi:acetylornithine/succinyldiaminopimelate/putrescine aminotransferase
VPNLTTAAQPDRLSDPAAAYADGALVVDAAGACYVDCTGGSPPADSAARQRVLRTLLRLAEANPLLRGVCGEGTSLQIDVDDDLPVLEILRDHGVLATMTGCTLTIAPPAGMTEQDLALLCDALWASLQPTAD